MRSFLRGNEMSLISFELMNRSRSSSCEQELLVRRQVTRMWCNVSVVDSSGQTLAQLSSFLGHQLLSHQRHTHRLNKEHSVSSMQSYGSSEDIRATTEQVPGPVNIQTQSEIPIVSDERPIKREEFERVRPFLRQGLSPPDALELYQMIGLVTDAANAHKVCEPETLA